MPPRTRTELPRPHFEDLADERNDAVVVRELQAGPAPAQPIGREHRFALEADKRPAVTRGHQPQLPGATHSVADAFVGAVSTQHATVNQGKSSHGCSFARGYKRATRPTREFGKRSRRPEYLNRPPCGRPGVALVCAESSVYEPGVVRGDVEPISQTNAQRTMRGCWGIVGAPDRSLRLMIVLDVLTGGLTWIHRRRSGSSCRG